MVEFKADVEANEGKEVSKWDHEMGHGAAI